MPSGKTPTYQVNYSDLVRQRLQQLGQRAKQLGFGADFIASLQHVDDRLHAEPKQVGEPYQYLAHLGLSVQIAGTPYFYLRFAIDEGRSLVYVIDCVGSARIE